jgi:hypothetical protein
VERRVPVKDVLQPSKELVCTNLAIIILQIVKNKLSSCTVKDGVKDRTAYLEDRDDPAVDLLRDCSITDRPCGDVSFVARMEAVLGRKLVPRDRGRPKRRG